MWTSTAALSALLAAPPSLDAELKALQAAAEDHVAYEVVASLTTEVGPRLAGTEAEARARAWAVAKLRALGFERVRVEPAVVRGWERGPESARVLSPSPQALAVTALGRSVATPKAGIEAPVVRFESLAELEAVEAGALDRKSVV